MSSASPVSNLGDGLEETGTETDADLGDKDSQLKSSLSVSGDNIGDLDLPVCGRVRDTGLLKTKGECGATVEAGRIFRP